MQSRKCKVFGLRKRFWMPLLCIFASLYIISAVSKEVTVRHVYGICPAFVVNNDRIFNCLKNSQMNNGFGGGAKGIIIILPAKGTPNNVLEHELVHVRQFYRSISTLTLLYYFDRCKSMVESEAYVTEILKESDIPFYAEMIHYAYDLKIPIEATEQHLMHYWRQRCSSH